MKKQVAILILGVLLSMSLLSTQVSATPPAGQIVVTGDDVIATYISDSDNVTVIFYVTVYNVTNNYYVNTTSPGAPYEFNVTIPAPTSNETVTAEYSLQVDNITISMLVYTYTVLNVDVTNNINNTQNHNQTQEVVIINLSEPNLWDVNHPFLWCVVGVGAMFLIAILTNVVISTGSKKDRKYSDIAEKGQGIPRW